MPAWVTALAASGARLEDNLEALQASERGDRDLVDWTIRLHPAGYPKAKT